MKTRTKFTYSRGAPAESDLKTNLQQHLQPRFTYLELLDNKEENKWINEQKAGICNDKHG